MVGLEAIDTFANPDTILPTDVAIVSTLPDIGKLEDANIEVEAKLLLRSHDGSLEPEEPEPCLCGCLDGTSTFKILC